MRLEKYLARSGVTSRRTAQKQIITGRVTVNDERVLIPGTHIEPDRDLIKVDGQRVEGTPEHIYLMLNKPPGYVTTVRDERHRPTVMEFVKEIPERIYPVGRLDRDTEGLLLMTNDGEFANRLTHPRHEVKKRISHGCAANLARRLFTNYARETESKEDLHLRRRLRQFHIEKTVHNSELLSTKARNGRFAGCFKLWSIK